MRKTTHVLQGLGNLVIVIAITTVTNHLVDLRADGSKTIVDFSGSLAGWTSAFLLCAFLVFMWVKLQYFTLSYRSADVYVIISGTGTCIAALLYAYSSLQCMATDFGQATYLGMLASYVFLGGYALQIVCDALLAAKSEDYIMRLRLAKDGSPWHALNVAVGIFALRVLVLCFMAMLAFARSAPQPIVGNPIAGAIQGLSAETAQIWHLVLVAASIALGLIIIFFVWIPEGQARAKVPSI